MSKRLLNTFIGVILIAIIGYSAGSYFGSRDLVIESEDLSSVEGIEPYVSQGEIQSFEDGKLVIFDRDILQSLEFEVDENDVVNFINVDSGELVQDAGLAEIQVGRIAGVGVEVDHKVIIDVFTVPDFEKIKAEIPEEEIITQ